MRVRSLPHRLVSSCSSVFLGGNSRFGLNRLALGLAKALDPGFIWLEIRDEASPDDPREPIAAGLIPVSQQLVTRSPSELKPETGIERLGLWTIFRQDRPEETTKLVDFLRFPDTIQELLSGVVRSPNPRVLVASNSDRLAGFYPNQRGGLRPFIDTLNRQGISLLSVVPKMTREDRDDFEFVLKLDVPSAERWTEGTVVVEKAPEGDGLHAGERLSFAELPFPVP